MYTNYEEKYGDSTESINDQPTTEQGSTLVTLSQGSSVVTPLFIFIHMHNTQSDQETIHRDLSGDTIAEEGGESDNTSIVGVVSESQLQTLEEMWESSHKFTIITDEHSECIAFEDFYHSKANNTLRIIVESRNTIKEPVYKFQLQTNEEEN